MKILPVILPLVLAVFTMAGCDVFTPKNPACEVSNATLQAQAVAQTKGSEAQLEMQKRIGVMQLDVAKRCADRGDVPVFVNGNVDCKPKGVR